MNAGRPTVGRKIAGGGRRLCASLWDGRESGPPPPGHRPKAVHRSGRGVGGWREVSIDAVTGPAGELVERMLAGDRRALARLITRVENRAAAVPEIMRRVAPAHRPRLHGGSHRAPGAGKSTLVDRLTAALRKTGATVGDHRGRPDEPVHRGRRPWATASACRPTPSTRACSSGAWRRAAASGGLARATAEVQKLLDAFGLTWVLVETVGVGQTELDVIKLADTTVVVLVPESGDAIQTMKAGLLEAADVLVVNKADREGAPRLMTELRYMVHLHREGQQASRDLDWEVPILATEAVNGTWGRGAGLRRSAATARCSRGAAPWRGAGRRGASRELRDLILAELRQEVDRALADGGALAPLLVDVEAGRVDPYTAIGEVRARWERPGRPGSTAGGLTEGTAVGAPAP